MRHLSRQLMCCFKNNVNGDSGLVNQDDFFTNSLISDM